MFFTDDFKWPYCLYVLQMVDFVYFDFVVNVLSFNMVREMEGGKDIIISDR